MNGQTVGHLAGDLAWGVAKRMAAVAAISAALIGCATDGGEGARDANSSRATPIPMVNFPILTNNLGKATRWTTALHQTHADSKTNVVWKDTYANGWHTLTVATNKTDAYVTPPEWSPTANQ